MSSDKIRIAISGGGVAGASLLRALQPHPHLDVHIFESASQFREAGIAFGLTPNAERALDMIGPSTRACLERAGGIQMSGARVYVAQGSGTGGRIMYKTPGPTMIQRANLLHELLADARPEQMHVSKRLVEIERQAGGWLRLQFEDGSTHDCDILVGADGVHSTVRKLILDKDDPAAAPQKSPWWALMTLNPYQKARDSIGSAMIDIEQAFETGWVGNRTLMWSNILSHGELVQFSILSSAELPTADNTSQWGQSVTAETLKSMYVTDEWPSHLQQAVLKLLCDQPSRQTFSVWEHAPAPTYASGRVCVFGDAAHATTPFQGSGGGMCVEDAMILSTLLAKARNPEEAAVALQAYDSVRRERTQRVVESSHETGELITGTHKIGKLDPKKLDELLYHRWDFILDIDLVKHRDDAARQMEEGVASLQHGP